MLTDRDTVTYTESYPFGVSDAYRDAVSEPVGLTITDDDSEPEL